MNTIFKTSALFSSAKVYQDRVVYKPFPLMGEQTIFINQIASVEPGMAGFQQVKIETTGGKRYKLIIRLRDKKGFVEAIQNTISNIKNPS